MNRLTKSVVILGTWGMLSACGQPHGKNQADLKAPSSQEEAKSRFIIQGTPSDTQAVLSASESHRVLSAKHNLYEVKGLNYLEIKKLAPSIHAEQNQYFETQSIEAKVNPYKTFKVQRVELKNLLVALAADDEGEQQPPAELPPALQGCDIEAKVLPELHIDEVSDVLQTSATINLGESVIFSGAGSKAINPEEGDVVIQWDIFPPSGSKIESGLRVGEEFQIDTDMVGAYMIIMVARDPSNACALFQGQFLVTHNPDFQFPVEGEEKPQVKSLDPFTHLARIRAQQAWEKATGEGVTIAIVDSGLNYLHPGIKFNLAVNTAELEGEANNDEDGNELSDDILGWDFINGDNMPFDDQGHGSHVAGLSASHIHGVAKDAKVLPVKVLSAGGSGDVASVAAGIFYAVDRGADVINTSLGGFQSNVQIFEKAIEYAHSKNVAFISASGNDKLDLGLPENEIFPGEIDRPNVVNVAALGVEDELASYSNFGKLETDVAAPGGDRGGPLYSLATINPHGAQFIGLAGTSMASPVVAGVAALIKQAHPQISTEELRAILMSSGTDKETLTDVVGSGKALDALEAVEKAEALANSGGDDSVSPIASLY